MHLFSVCQVTFEMKLQGRNSKQFQVWYVCYFCDKITEMFICDLLNSSM